MINIFARSPYIIEIDETGQTETKVELYIWNDGTSTPTSASYTLQKLIPSSNEPATWYDVSPYILEFITFDSYNSGAYPSTPVNIGNTPRDQYANVTIKRYADTGSGMTLIDSTDYFGFAGYTFYADGSNYDYGDIHLDSGTYYYYDDGQGALGNLEYERAVPSVRVIEDALALTAYYTNLDTAATYSEAIATEPMQVPLIYKSYYGDSVKLEIKDASLNVLATYTSEPVTQCKHTPVKIDFVNKYGNFERFWCFGASFEYTDVEAKEHKRLQSSITSYNTAQGQMSEFNINGKSRIKVNTDWVEESFSETVKQLLLSEKILVNGYPAKLNTKSIEEYKHINTKMINYEMEFTYNHYIINNVG
jgi:hypothetical protein